MTKRTLVQPLYFDCHRLIISFVQYFGKTEIQILQTTHGRL